MFHHVRNGAPRSPRRGLLRTLLILSLPLFVLEGCQTSPTGRRQIILMSDSAVNEMGLRSFDELKGKVPIEKNPAINTYVKCVARAILSVAQDPTGVSQWEIVVFRQPEANAFALPGGKIGVNTGLLQVAETPAQLAGVLGHEVAHVIARHGNERASQTTVAQSGLSVVDMLAGNSQYRDTILGILGIGTQYGVLLPFSRTHESEADVIGQKLMARAGFDPGGSVELWRNMESRGGGAQPPEILSTHPSHSRRIQELEENLQETYPIYLMAKRQGVDPGCRVP